MAYDLLDTYIWVVCGWLRVQNRHQKDIMCLEVVGLRYQILLTILSTKVDIIRGTYMTI